MTECKLSLREGKRIRAEASKPYAIKAQCCMVIALVLSTGMILWGDYRYGVLWKGKKALEERVLSGDPQAILDLLAHDGLVDVGIMAALAFLLCAMFYVYIGEKRADEALKKANEEKLDDDDKEE